MIPSKSDYAAELAKVIIALTRTALIYCDRLASLC